MGAMVSITQFSDTHFSRPGNRSHGGFGYDTDAAWAASAAQAFAKPTDLTVVTGDVADHGEADEYLVAIERFADIPTPANVLPGNHDFHVPLTVSLPRPGLSMDRVQRVGPWLFVFADSNGDGKTVDADGRLVDKADRIETNGLLGPQETAWIDEMIGASDAEHVWLWMHHPPAMSGAFASPEFDSEVGALLERNPTIRGIGAGHVHTDLVVELAERPVYVCPAQTINFDIVNWTTLPPGYRTYEFGDDGSVSSECHLIDDDRWPRIDLPESVISFFRGEADWDEMVAGITGG